MVMIRRGQPRVPLTTEQELSVEFPEEPPSPLIEIGEDIEGADVLVNSLLKLYPEMFRPEASFGLSEEEIPLSVIQTIESFANDTPEEFLTDLLSKGLDNDAAVVLGALGVGDADIQEIISIPPIEREQPLIEPPPEPIERVIIERDGVRELVIRTEDNSLYDRNGDWIGFYNFVEPNKPYNPYLAESLTGKTLDALVGGIGDILNVSSGVAGRFGYEDVANKLATTGNQLSVYGVPTSSADFQVSDLMNPEFYATKVARTIPFALSLMPLAIGGYYAGSGVAASVGLGTIWQAVIGGLASAGLSRPLESLMEAGGQYNDAIARGKTEQEASTEFDQVFRENMVLACCSSCNSTSAL